VEATCATGGLDAFPDWKIVEGHHDDGPFNRSAAINRARADSRRPCDVLCRRGRGRRRGNRTSSHAAIARARRRRVGSCSGSTSTTTSTSRRRGGRSTGAERAARARPLSGAAAASQSSLLAVPRTLWERVGGFDDRFVGWGAEDDAFAAACRVLGGGMRPDRRRSRSTSGMHPRPTSAAPSTAQHARYGPVVTKRPPTLRRCARMHRRTRHRRVRDRPDRRAPALHRTGGPVASHCSRE
jgi:hypothetical protein